jgi:hypothetical protein
MKTTALILGLLGGLVTARCGMSWVSYANRSDRLLTQWNQSTARDVQALNKDLPDSEKIAFEGPRASPSMRREDRLLRLGGYLLITLGVLSVIAAALGFKIGKRSGLVTFPAGVLTALLAPICLGTIERVPAMTGGLLVASACCALWPVAGRLRQR